MKRILVWGLIACVFALGSISGMSIRESRAEEKRNFENFKGVIPFFTTGGYFGFFDQKDGQIFIYDEQMRTCLYRYKIQKLGNPGVDLYANPSLQSKPGAKDEELFGDIFVVGEDEGKRKEETSPDENTGFWPN